MGGFELNASCHNWFQGPISKMEGVIHIICTCILFHNSYSNGDAPTSLHNLNCASSQYLNVFQCNYSTYYDYSCADGTIVSVTCCELVQRSVFEITSTTISF